MKCEKCGKEHDGSYGSGRFCSKECARGFSGSNRSLESKLKTSKSVSKIHLHKCPICGIVFLNKGTAANIRCQTCRIIKNHKCPICGAVDRKHCKKPEICKHYKSFPRFIKYLGFNSNMLGSNMAYVEYEKMKLYVYDLYWNKLMTISLIATMVGYTSSTGSFAILLSKLIKFRNFKLAAKTAIETGRYKVVSEFKYHCLWHTTWFGSKVYCRSSYEKDYCDELDLLKILYSMESLKIQYYDTLLKKLRYAYPDFYLPETNTIVEVKSKWTLDRQNMIDRVKLFLNLGYNFDLLYEHKHYHGMTFFTLDA